MPRVLPIILTGPQKGLQRYFENFNNKRELNIPNSEQLKAPIKMCQCGHSFCHDCLVAYVSNSNSWACPKCRQITNSTVDALPRNFDLERIVESFNNVQIQPNPNTEFELCDRHQMPIKLRK